MEFCDTIDEYAVLKLPLNSYKGTSRTLEPGFQLAGSEATKRFRNDEKRLLKSNFHNWAAPYDGNLKGWRDDSPIYVSYLGSLVGGLYLCDQNEFGEGSNWGQLHYFYTDPSFKGKGIHSILFKEALYKAKLWNLQGVIVNTDRYLLPEVYIRWGAILWKRIKKKRSTMDLADERIILNLIKRPMRALKKQLKRLKKQRVK